jgi:hypothetical protein
MGNEVGTATDLIVDFADRKIIPTAPLETASAALHAEMERLDPVGPPNWSDLSEGERHFYRSCVEAVWPIIRRAVSEPR